MSGGLVITVSFMYLGLIFAIAYYGDIRAERGRSLAKNPYIYTLSIAVFCTSWTFYGSVGRAATSGLGFLPIYLGPTLMFMVWSVVLVKIIRICKVNRITSIADFISSRYGKSSILGGLVTIIAVVGTTPYISLQLKSIATSFTILVNAPDEPTVWATSGEGIFAMDTTFMVALILAVFSILFGTRHIDASEHHEGLVAAIAFESLVKLFAFLAVGIFVTYGINDGFVDLFTKAQARADLDFVFNIGDDSGYSEWMTMTILSMAAIICLPRQFYITAVENTDEGHLRKAVWLFPLYLLIINLFVLPIAVGGKMIFAGTVADADMFVLTVPIFHDQGILALFVFIGGLSAASSMVIVAAIALSTMVCNNMVMPLLLHFNWAGGAERRDLSGLLLLIRRASIVVILLLGYGYFRIASESYSLVTIGLVSFSAAAQFAPAIFIGIFWKGASRNGALTGLLLGFIIWAYTLLLPSFAQSGWLPISFIDQGPYGIEFLKPYALFGLEGLDRLTHALLWSMLFNIGGFMVVSLRSNQGAMERIQGGLFVDVFLHTEGQKESGSRYWSGTATIADLQELVGRFVGGSRAAQAFLAFARENNIQLNKSTVADSALLDHAETLLAGAIGSATARVMIGSVVKGEIVGLDDVYQILDETSQVIEYSRQLETKSVELEDTTRQLQSANNRLQEFDLLKVDLFSTISHELRTPLTAIRAFSEILSDNEEVAEVERQRFLNVIIKESQRLTRLIDQILDLAKMEAGRMDWSMGRVDLSGAINQALAAMDGLMKEKNVALKVAISDGIPPVMADRDQLVQVVINLLSNAIKFCRHPGGVVEVAVIVRFSDVLVSVTDNGAGILPENYTQIFEKYHQTNQASDQMPRGTGLGLAICREIITFFGGEIWVKTTKEKGACFLFSIPFAYPVINENPAMELSAE